jgi:hypothetical protein
VAASCHMMAACKGASGRGGGPVSVATQGGWRADTGGHHSLNTRYARADTTLRPS